MSLQDELGLHEPFQDVCHEAVLDIVRTASVLSLEGAGLFRQFDLTVAQFNVLFALSCKDRAVTQSDLSTRLVVTRASVTSVLDKMEEKGLVARKVVPENRRIYHVDVTAAGRALYEKVEPLYRARLRAVMGDLTIDERKTLIHLLDRVREQARKMDEANG